MQLFVTALLVFLGLAAFSAKADPPSYGLVKVSVDEAPIYHGADANSQQEDTAYRGQTFNLRAAQPIHGFYKILYQGHTSFISADQVNPVSDDSGQGSSDTSTQNNGDNSKALKQGDDQGGNVNEQGDQDQNKVKKGHEGGDEEDQEGGNNEEPWPTATATKTRTPTKVPTKVPTKLPTRIPTKTATPIPTRRPTPVPTQAPEEETEATLAPTAVPTRQPTAVPTQVPVRYVPTAVPTQAPEEEAPTPVPTRQPTAIPTPVPTPVPTAQTNAWQAPTPVPTRQSNYGWQPQPTAVPTAPSSTGPNSSSSNSGNQTGMLAKTIHTENLHRNDYREQKTYYSEDYEGHPQRDYYNRYQYDHRSNYGGLGPLMAGGIATHYATPDNSSFCFTVHGLGGGWGWVQPAFHPVTGDAEPGIGEGGVGVGFDWRVLAPLRLFADWTYHTYSVMAAYAGQAPQADYLGGLAPAPSTDINETMRTHAFRLGAKLGIPWHTLEPWIGGSVGKYLWSVTYESPDQVYDYGSDSGLVFGMNAMAGLDWNVWTGPVLWRFSGFVEWLSPVVYPRIENLASLGPTWKDNDDDGTPVMAPVRIGGSIGLGW